MSNAPPNKYAGPAISIICIRRDATRRNTRVRCRGGKGFYRTAAEDLKPYAKLALDRETVLRTSDAHISPRGL